MKVVRVQSLILVFLIIFVLITPLFFASGTYLNDLEDVTISGVTDNSVLMYDSASANWTNDNVSSGSCKVSDGWMHTWNTTATNSSVLYNTIGLKDLTAAEVNQLENIGSESISVTEWSYLADLDQSVDKQENVEFDQLTINEDSALPSAINIKPASGQDGKVVWFCDGDTDEWRYYVTENNKQIFKLDYYDGTTTFTGLRTALNIGFPSNWLGWGFAGQTNPTYGTQLPNVVGNNGGDLAKTHPVYSDNRSKWFIGDLPKQKLRVLCGLIELQMYYNINHTYDDDGNIIFDSDPYRDRILIGVDAQKLYYDIMSTFSYPLNEKIVRSIVQKPDDENKNFWSVDYDILMLCKIQNIENILEDFL